MLDRWAVADVRPASIPRPARRKERIMECSRGDAATYVRLCVSANETPRARSGTLQALPESRDIPARRATRVEPLEGLRGE
jgi:hypothetical protein